MRKVPGRYRGRFGVGAAGGASLSVSPLTRRLSGRSKARASRPRVLSVGLRRPALNARDVGPVQLGLFSELFLRPPLGEAAGAEAVAKGSAKVHDPGILPKWARVDVWSLRFQEKHQQSVAVDQAADLCSCGHENDDSAAGLVCMSWTAPGTRTTATWNA